MWTPPVWCPEGVAVGVEAPVWCPGRLAVRVVAPPCGAPGVWRWVWAPPLWCSKGVAVGVDAPVWCLGGVAVGVSAPRVVPRGCGGGHSSIVSTTTIYNEMVARRPDLAAVLTNPLYRTRWGEVPEGRKPYYGTAPFNLTDGRLICTYVRSAVRKAQLMDAVPRLTPEQAEAMDLFDELANDPALHLDMKLAPGDMQFVCNHAVAHSRTAYEDYPEPVRRRHLLRLWLACADGPELPAAYTGEHQGKTASGRPNGIKVPDVPLVAPLEAEA